MKTLETQTQEAQRMSRIKKKKTTTRYIKIKPLKTSIKIKIFSVAKGKKKITYRGAHIRMIEDISSKTMQARR